MRPYLADPDVTLWHGDALDVLRGLPDGSVDCCVTSPPYWGLRDYGHDGQLGLERTPDEYVARLVELFGEVRRVLRAHGTLWLNLGDTYTSGNRDGHGTRVGFKQQTNRGMNGDNDPARAPTPPSLKPKDLIGIPWRVAFALQADGWWLRSDIVWSKPNPMPESVRDRPTKSHEYVFLLAKSESYYFGREDLREPAAWERWGDQTTPKHNGTDTGAGWIPARTKEELRGGLTGGAYHPPGQTPHSNAREPRGKALTSPRQDGNSWNENNGRGFIPTRDGRNVRSVWTIATEPYAGAHFAVFPQELARRCILGGCPPGGTVLDPFAGSGTTLYVGRALERNAVGIELNADYCRLAAERLQQLSLLAEGAA